MKQTFAKLLILLTSFYSFGCSELLSIGDTSAKSYTDEYTNDFSSDPDDTTSSFLDNNHPALINLRKRAHQIADLEWYTLGDVPSLGGVYAAGRTYIGIPYSSVKELNKYIGQDVSFYTFLSAVNNPRSVLYTERVSEYPYNGVNCASYYGSVCSMTINYALGFDMPYQSRMYGSLPFIMRVADQNFRSLRSGDIIWQEGHVLLVIDVSRDDSGLVEKIEILENKGYCAFIKSYTLNEFEQMWEGIEWIIYRNVELHKLADESGLYVIPEDEYIESITFNADLSLDRGDKVTYREGEIVKVNILSSDYSTLELYKSGKLIDSKTYTNTPDISFSNLPYGQYEVKLSDNKRLSDPVYFEILQTDTSVLVEDRYITVSFHSDNATPEYVLICTKRGGMSFISEISSQEKLKGYKVIKVSADLDGRYVKVFYRGTYGRVSNHIISL